MDILKQIEHYQIELVWEHEEYEEDEDSTQTENVQTLNNFPCVTAFPYKTGGYWSGNFTTVKEAVTHCLSVNNLAIIT